MSFHSPISYALYRTYKHTFLVIACLGKKISACSKLQALKQVVEIPKLSVLHSGFREYDKVRILWPRRVPDIVDNMNVTLVDDFASRSYENAFFSHLTFGFTEHIDFPIALVINLACE